ncbi:MAG: non-heme iron oxygenase ferredoxin subunit [Gammaproteobacteria bacterium]
MPEAGYIAIAPVDEITENRVHCFEVEGVRLVLCNVGGEIYAVENQCSHADSGFDKGRVRRHKLLCPLHGAIFDVRDGSVLGKPAFSPIKTYPVVIEDGQVYVKVES